MQIAYPSHELPLVRQIHQHPSTKFSLSRQERPSIKVNVEAERGLTEGAQRVANEGFVIYIKEQQPSN